jgi:plastocyanin
MMETVRERGTRRAKIRVAVFLGTAALALGLIAAGAWAMFTPIGSTDNSYTGGAGDPANPTFTMDQGDRPSFSDGGVNQHNVTARQNGPDGKSLFSTPTLNGGQSATLDGTQYLAAGTYTFFCTIHPTEMQATLVVTGNGTPQARPSATARLKTKTISKALKKGLQVAVTASTQVNGATVTAKLGKATIGKTGASLSAGAQNVKLKLSKAGKSKLRKKRSAKVTVTVDVPFGAPATAKAKLK